MAISVARLRGDVALLECASNTPASTSGSLGGLVDERKVAELPLNGRYFMDLTLPQPGIT